MSRTRIRNDVKESGNGPVIYWMSREQRVNDNRALSFAQTKGDVIVVFCLAREFLNATDRAYSFMLEGLQEVAKELQKNNIHFILRTGDVAEQIISVIEEYKAHALVVDFDPLKIKRSWIEKVIQDISIPVYEVDGHNIVPCWTASEKQEYGAYTIRPKIKKKIAEFLVPFDSLRKQQRNEYPETIKWNKINRSWSMEVRPIDWLTPGEKAAKEMLKIFIKDKLMLYHEQKNDPNKDTVSHLSAYLHFGQISSERIALEVMKAQLNSSAEDSFLEELIVRKELSDNYCYYNRNYDNFKGFPVWAQKTLQEHKKDKRDYIYSLKEFEHAKTHDELWNAAQREMRRTGKMHGYMRMYWAKKILEWTESPKEAQRIAIYLNDRYEIDGRDPNGYTGIAWSIGGVHDRAWKERAVFGKVRYMNYNGAKRKFDVNAYIEKNLQ